MKITAMKSKLLQKAKPMSCSVSGPLHLMYQLVRFGGGCPVQFERRRSKCTMTTSLLHWSVNCLIMIVFDVLATIGLVVDMNVDPEQSSRARTSSTRRMVWVCELLMTMFTCSVIVFSGMRTTKRSIKSFNQLQKLNVLLDKEETKLEWIKNVLITLSIFFLTSLAVSNYAVFIRSAIASGRDLYSAALYFFYYVGVLPLLFMKVQFTIVTLEGRNTVAMLNARLESTSQLQCLQCSTKLTHDYIRQLASMYDRVFDIISDINVTYQLEVIVMLSKAFFQLIVTPYNIIVNLASQKVHLPLLVLEIIWMVVDIVSIAAIVEPCHRTHQEVNRAKHLVSKFIISTTDEKVSAELEKFFRFLTLNEVAYAPFGICTISRSLIATIAGSVATYLVILVQFQGPDSGEY